MKFKRKTKWREELDKDRNGKWWVRQANLEKHQYENVAGPFDTVEEARRELWRRMGK